MFKFGLEDSGLLGFGAVGFMVSGLGGYRPLAAWDLRALWLRVFVLG